MNPIALSFFEKKIENLEYIDLYNLVCVNKIPESYNLDYKVDYPKNEKLAKLMCSFANASGGYIIVGIEEVRVNNKNTSVPDEMFGIDKADHTTKVTNIAISHSQPKIVPSIKTIELDSDPDKVVVIIKIEESMEPIMYYSKNDSDSNKFFIRINDKKQPADYSILKKLFHKENYLERMKVFEEEILKEQKEFIYHKLGRFYKEKTGAIFFGVNVLPFNKDFEIIDMASSEFEAFLNGLNRTFHEIPIFFDYRLSSFIKKFKFMGYYYESKIVDIKDLEEDIYPVVIDPNVQIIGTTDFDDTFMASNLPVNSYGLWSQIQIGRVNGSGLRRELIRGATGSLPAGTITGASLFFHRIAGGAHSANPGTMSIYRVAPANDWREGTGSNSNTADDPDWNQCKSGSQNWAGHPTLACGVSGIDFIADGSPPGGAY
ncbi:hypothetical protein LCGC14_1722020, partial [marine sediment metagenome]